MEGETPIGDLSTGIEHSLSLARQGEVSELGHLLEEFRPYLLAIANSEFPQILASKLAPSDLVQLTIVKGFNDFAAFRGATAGEFAGWLRRILLNSLNAVSREFNRDKRDLTREEAADSRLVDQQQSPSGVAVSIEEQELLNAALLRLSDDYRKALELRYVDGLSFAEIGVRLERSEEAARKLWARAVKQMQQELQIDDSRNHASISEKPRRG